MKKTLVSLLVFITYFAYILWIEGFCATTIIWFSDWGHSQNVRLILHLFVASGAHYLIMSIAFKYALLGCGVNKFLFGFDIVICSTMLLSLLALSLFFGTMPFSQVIFTAVVQVMIILLRILFVTYLHKTPNA